MHQLKPTFGREADVCVLCVVTRSLYTDHDARIHIISELFAENLQKFYEAKQQEVDELNEGSDEGTSKVVSNVGCIA